MKFVVLASALAVSVSSSAYANWSGSKSLNDEDRVQVIGDNIYVNLGIKRDFSSLVNVPLSSGNPEKFDPKKVDLSQFGSCPFTEIDMSGYDNMIIANGGTVSNHDKDRQAYAMKQIDERNNRVSKCSRERLARAKAEHNKITLDTLALQENELDQTNTETYRVVTTGSDQRTFTGRISNCLTDCTYTNTKTTVMFELEGNAYIISITQRVPYDKFFKITREYLDTNTFLGARTKIIPIDNY
ncbi:hypothetical protein AB4177_14635 [Vibrio breoganii]